MNESLYFVPMIARALQEKDPATALRKTFEEIRRLGSQPADAQGYQQFLRFMGEIRSRSESPSQTGEEPIPDVLVALLVERADQVLEGDPVVHRASTEPNQSLWQARYEELWVGIFGAMARPSVCEVLIEKSDAHVAVCALGPNRTTQSVRDIAPGDYRIVLETGRVLWDGHLDEQDLIWSKAFPTQPLKMAADTGDAARKPTRQLNLLEGALVVRVYAGIEAGTLEVELRDMEVGA